MAKEQTKEKPVVISTDSAPKAIGPYNQGIKFNNLIFTSGQIGMVPSTGNLISDTIEEQTQQAMKNLKAVVEAAGSSLNSVVKTTDMNNFGKVNPIYEKYFKESYNLPARSCVGVKELPKNALFEIQAIAISQS